MNACCPALRAGKGQTNLDDLPSALVKPEFNQGKTWH